MSEKNEAILYVPETLNAFDDDRWYDAQELLGRRIACLRTPPVFPHGALVKFVGRDHSRERFLILTHPSFCSAPDAIPLSILGQVAALRVLDDEPRHPHRRPAADDNRSMDGPREVALLVTDGLRAVDGCGRSYRATQLPGCRLAPLVPSRLFPDGAHVERSERHSGTGQERLILWHASFDRRDYATRVPCIGVASELLVTSASHYGHRPSLDELREMDFQTASEIYARYGRDGFEAQPLEREIRALARGHAAVYACVKDFDRGRIDWATAMARAVMLLLESDRVICRQSAGVDYADLSRELHEEIVRGLAIPAMVFEPAAPSAATPLFKPPLNPLWNAFADKTRAEDSARSAAAAACGPACAVAEQVTVEISSTSAASPPSDPPGETWRDRPSLL